ncbi:MAG: hypothetical protein IT301_02955 [Dehalococcoidia bacterium]|nr:hypothetical protein [Dehalococcoidia bacterium]
MPRPRTGLGQGLEALVPPLREAPIAAFAQATTAWEFAVLRRIRKTRCRLTIAPSALLQRPDRRMLKTSLILALGAMGAAGWELTAINDDRYYFKRPATDPAG